MSPLYHSISQLLLPCLLLWSLTSCSNILQIKRKVGGGDEIVRKGNCTLKVNTVQKQNRIGACNVCTQECDKSETALEINDTVKCVPNKQFREKYDMRFRFARSGFSTYQIPTYSFVSWPRDPITGIVYVEKLDKDVVVNVLKSCTFQTPGCSVFLFGKGTFWCVDSCFQLTEVGDSFYLEQTCSLEQQKELSGKIMKLNIYCNYQLTGVGSLRSSIVFKINGSDIFDDCNDLTTTPESEVSPTTHNILKTLTYSEFSSSSLATEPS